MKHLTILFLLFLISCTSDQTIQNTLAVDDSSALGGSDSLGGLHTENSEDTLVNVNDTIVEEEVSDTVYKSLFTIYDSLSYTWELSERYSAAQSNGMYRHETQIGTTNVEKIADEKFMIRVHAEVEGSTTWRSPDEYFRDTSYSYESIDTLFIEGDSSNYVCTKLVAGEIDTCLSLPTPFTDKIVNVEDLKLKYIAGEFRSYIYDGALYVDGIGRVASGFSDSGNGWHDNYSYQITSFNGVAVNFKGLYDALSKN